MIHSDYGHVNSMSTPHMLAIEWQFISHTLTHAPTDTTRCVYMCAFTCTTQ